tara:strand:+ start:5976 stop:6824 length:849 start_codon:yes stop_codon:yes gene_type:complete
MKVGIIGYGFVGKALNSAFNKNIDVIKIDPILKTKIKDLKDFNPNLIFICVPTPMNNDGSQNTEIVSEVLTELRESKISSFVALKSTIHPGNIKKIQNLYPKFILNPEFLREKHAELDFINSDLIVFGGDKDVSKIFSDFYSRHTKCICDDHFFTDLATASLIKYTINSFLATKVTFFNEINNLFNLQQTDENWDNFIAAISRDKRMGGSHMSVPGPDGRYGFGGACFPKDTSAILRYAKDMNCELNLIETTIKINNKIRESYDKLTDREYDQNIKYNLKEE